MIRINGVSVTDIAPVQLVDIDTGAVEVEAVARERSVRSGSDFVRWRGARREVEITFALLTENRELRQAQIIALNKWALGDGGPQRLTFADRPGVYLTGVCTGFPEPSFRMWWEAGLAYRWECYDPFWYAMTEKVVACGTAFKAQGVTPLIKIKHTLSASGDLTYSDGTRSMTFNSVPAGNLVIDLDAQTAAVNGVSIMDKYAFTSSFLLPQNAMTITGSGNVHITERWA